jgi:beta-galactosidase
MMLFMNVKTKNTIWKKLSLGKFPKPEKIEVSADDYAARITVSNRVKGDLNRRYTITADGAIQVDINVTAKKELPKVGMQVEFDKEFDTFAWFGKGPHDTYRDRQYSGTVGLYGKKVTDDQDEFIRPQEHGNKLDVRWLTLVNSHGQGVKVQANGTFLNASVWPYTLRDLETAAHVHELPDHKTTTLNIDFGQKGLGNIVMPVSKELRLLPNQTYSFSFTITELR